MTSTFTIRAPVVSTPSALIIATTGLITGYHPHCASHRDFLVPSPPPLQPWDPDAYPLLPPGHWKTLHHQGQVSEYSYSYNPMHMTNRLAPSVTVSKPSQCVDAPRLEAGTIQPPDPMYILSLELGRTSWLGIRIVGLRWWGLRPQSFPACSGIEDLPISLSKDLECYGDLVKHLAAALNSPSASWLQVLLTHIWYCSTGYLHTHWPSDLNVLLQHMKEPWLKLSSAPVSPSQLDNICPMGWCRIPIPSPQTELGHDQLLIKIEENPLHSSWQRRQKDDAMGMKFFSTRAWVTVYACWVTMDSVPVQKTRKWRPASCRRKGCCWGNSYSPLPSISWACLQRLSQLWSVLEMCGCTPQTCNIIQKQWLRIFSLKVKSFLVTLCMLSYRIRIKVLKPLEPWKSLPLLDNQNLGTESNHHLDIYIPELFQMTLGIPSLNTLLNLLFSISSAPRILAKTTMVLVVHLWTQGITIFHYISDWFYVALCKQVLQQDIVDTLAFLQELRL